MGFRDFSRAAGGEATTGFRSVLPFELKEILRKEKTISISRKLGCGKGIIVNIFQSLRSFRKLWISGPDST